MATPTSSVKVNPLTGALIDPIAATFASANGFLTGGTSDAKDSVRVATITAGTLATSFENGDTVDGIVLATSDRILIKNQAAGAENGIYTVNASGAPTRATDFDAWTEIVGAFVSVEAGTINAGTQWLCNVVSGGTLNTTAITFVVPKNFVDLTTNQTVDGNKYFSASSTMGGVTLSKDGVLAAVNAQLVFPEDDSVLAVYAAAGELSLRTTGITDVTFPLSGTLLSTAAIGVSVQAYDADLTTWAGITPGANVGTFLATPSGANLAAALTTALPETKGGTNQTTYTTGDLLYASAANTLSKLAGVATGNALISGGVGAIPAWGKIALTTHVSGTLPLTNGGTGQVTAKAAISALGHSLPSAIPGLVGWWCADDLALDGAAAPADGTDVTTWYSRMRTYASNTNPTFGSTGTNRPLYKTAIQNSLPGVLFDGTNDYMTAADMPVWSSLGTRYERTIIVAFKPTALAPSAANHYSAPNIVGTVGQYDGISVSPSGSDNVFTAWDYDLVGMRTAATAAFAINTTAILATWQKDGVSSISLNEAAAVTTTLRQITTSGSGVQLGTSGPGGYFTGHIFEVLFFTRALDTVERDTVTAYLRTKWNF